jgi:hypothetical protein
MSYVDDEVKDLLALFDQHFKEAYKEGDEFTRQGKSYSINSISKEDDEMYVVDEKPIVDPIVVAQIGSFIYSINFHSPKDKKKGAIPQ